MREKLLVKDLPEPWPLDKHGFPIIPKGHWPGPVLDQQEKNVKQMAHDFYGPKVREAYKKGTPDTMWLYFFCNHCGWFYPFKCDADGELCSKCGMGHKHNGQNWGGCVHTELIAYSLAWLDCHKIWDGLHAHFASLGKNHA